MATQPSSRPALEQALLTFEDSVEGRKAVLENFLSSRVWVLLDQPWDGRSLPSVEMKLLFVSDGENLEQAMLAVFTDRARAEAAAPAMGEFRHAVEADSQWTLLAVPKAAGVRINPNSEPSFRILPELTIELRKMVEVRLARSQANNPSSPPIRSR
ncbi:MAG TPA: SseB family protein [Gammaproteobacteria bacterium]|jgi:hypothetical protein